MLLLLAMASTTGAQVTPRSPITVTGHQWAPFMSPMGEPFRARSAADDTLADWFNAADRNRDGVLAEDEMVADAERFFATLDTNGDGQIDPDELSRYEYDIAPDIQAMAQTRRRPGQEPVGKRAGEDQPTAHGNGHARKGRLRESGDDADSSLSLDGALQGAARYSLLNLPEPVAAADADFDRVITREEFRAAARARFQLLDTASQGKLTLAQLEARLAALTGYGNRQKHDRSAPDARIGNPLPLSGL